MYPAPSPQTNYLNIYSYTFSSSLTTLRSHFFSYFFYVWQWGRRRRRFFSKNELSFCCVFFFCVYAELRLRRLHLCRVVYFALILHNSLTRATQPYNTDEGAAHRQWIRDDMIHAAYICNSNSTVEFFWTWVNHPRLLSLSFFKFIFILIIIIFLLRKAPTRAQHNDYNTIKLFSSAALLSPLVGERL